MAQNRQSKGRIQFQMGWGGLFALSIATLCALLWMFILGFWVGQKLVGRKVADLTQLHLLDQQKMSPPPAPLAPVAQPATPAPANADNGTGPSSLPELAAPAGQEPQPEATEHKNYFKESDLVTEAIKPQPPKPQEAEAPQPEAKTPSGPYYALQIASFRERGRADEEAERWRGKGLRALVRASDLGPKKGTWYRVYLGHFATADEAKTYAKKLGQSEGMKSYVVPLRD